MPAEYINERSVARFWSKVEKTDGCWIWKTGKTQDGYGQFSVGQLRIRAHRFSWELAHGKRIPRDRQVLHRCDNPSCVNPAHLFHGTIATNMRDRHRKNGYQSLSGENHHRAKLTPVAVREIRQRHANGELCGDIAMDYGTTRAAISFVVHRRTWKHVE